MVKKIRGSVRGHAIHFDEDLGFPDGEIVEVTVEQPITSSDSWGEGLRRCAGVLAEEWSETDDMILSQIRRQRKLDDRRLGGAS